MVKHKKDQLNMGLENESGENRNFPGIKPAESARADLIAYLAQTVLERLEEMEGEAAFVKLSTLPPGQLGEENQNLIKEIAALKARLQGIAQGI